MLVVLGYGFHIHKNFISYKVLHVKLLPVNFFECLNDIKRSKLLWFYKNLDFYIFLCR